MSRSEYVWVALNSNREPIAAFKRRYECVYWLNYRPFTGAEYVRRFLQDDPQRTYSVKDFLAAYA